jgi:hypothetical protein
MAALVNMLTIICTLRFGDGKRLVGELQAVSPGVPYPIKYTGDVSCLTTSPETGTPWDLELVFKLAACRTDGILTVDRVGDYESKVSKLKFSYS